ncbi:MAG TPA: hypothetical protein VLW49_09955 [Gaiellaceae bacterium]|nr:hypothetical protein [Gaiellaceae bacterium]
MSHQTLIAMLVTCGSGYAMLFSGLAKRKLRVAPRGRCRQCGRLRETCSCPAP